MLTNAVGQEWLSCDALREYAPDLVYVQVRGRGDGGPAVDYTVNAEVGFPMVEAPSVCRPPPRMGEHNEERLQRSKKGRSDAASV